MRSFGVLFVMLTVLLAGCLGGDADDVERETDEPRSGSGENKEVERPDPTETTGSLEGKIVNQDLEEISGAEVILSKDDEEVKKTLSGDNGRYTINGIDPGSYRLIADAPCCEVGVRNVAIEAGEVTQADLQVEQAKVIETYIDKNGEWNGFLGCTYHLWPGTQSANCAEVVQDENHDDVRSFNADIGLETIVVAVVWDPSPLSTTNQLHHRLERTDDGFDGPSPTEISRTNEGPPIIYRVDANPKGSALDFASAEEEMEFRIIKGTAVSGAVPPLTVTYQQDFTVYWHLFYGEPAPEGYDPRPDA